MHERIREAMAQAFEVPLDKIPEHATSDELEEWDSLRHLELVLELELAFGVSLSSEAIPELLSVDAIEEHLRGIGVPSA